MMIHLNGFRLSSLLSFRSLTVAETTTRTAMRPDRAYAYSCVRTRLIHIEKLRTENKRQTVNREAFGHIAATTTTDRPIERQPAKDILFTLTAADARIKILSFLVFH